MSDKFREMLDRYRAAEQKANIERPRELSPEAAAYFAKPANFCQLCGNPMEYSEDPNIAKWERRWSVHWSCREQAVNQLDRSVGILSERK